MARVTNGRGRGGAREGAGRKPGSKNKRRVQIADKAAAKGITPIEVMLQAMREHHEFALELEGMARLTMLAEATDMAVKAAPFVHPRLQAVQHTGSGGGPLQANITVKFVKAKETK